MRNFSKWAIISFSIALMIFFGGCFPTDDGKDGDPKPYVDPIVTPPNDKPEDLPTDINPAANTTEAGIDSMFNLLINHVENLDKLKNTTEFYTIDFTSLRKGFGAAINKNPNHIKANIGFMVSSVMSINSSAELQKMIDSLDSYIDDVDAYYDEDDYGYSLSLKKGVLSKKSTSGKGLLSKTYSKQGLLMTGQALIAETPKILLAQNKEPSFPRFVTLSYIQDAIEANVLPRLNEVIASAERLRAINGMSIPVTIEGETTEIDAGDICILEGVTKAARAGFMMMLTYNADIYSPDGSKDMRWIDSYRTALDTATTKTKKTVSLHGDTLFETTCYDFTSSTKYMSDVYQYNLKRSEFLSIRKNYHSSVYKDLKDIPVLVKEGLSLIDKESDGQDNDLIKATDILDASKDMIRFSEDLLEQGFSAKFASQFESPEALMDFITEVLSGPYAFDETIDGKHISMKVDISKFFTNPAANLKDYFPKYVLPSGKDRIVSIVYTEAEQEDNDYFYIYADDYDTVSISIPSSLIEDTVEEWDNYFRYELKNSYNYRIDEDSIREIVPIKYVDDKGNVVDYYSIFDDEFTKTTLQNVFPYFNDYTFKGIFPDMVSRQKWIDFFSVFID